MMTTNDTNDTNDTPVDELEVLTVSVINDLALEVYLHTGLEVSKKIRMEILNRMGEMALEVYLQTDEEISEEEIRRAVANLLDIAMAPPKIYVPGLGWV